MSDGSQSRGEGGVAGVLKVPQRVRVGGAQQHGAGGLPDGVTHTSHASSSVTSFRGEVCMLPTALP